MMAILYFILGWLLSGMILAWMNIYVYFRGPDHMLQIYEYHGRTDMEIKERYKRLKQIADENVIVPVFFIIAMLVPPIYLIGFIKEVYLFSYDLKIKEPKNDQ
jgi:hypothetical protein